MTFFTTPPLSRPTVSVAEAASIVREVPGATEAEEAVDAVRVYYDEVLQVYGDIEGGRVDVDRPD